MTSKNDYERLKTVKKVGITTLLINILLAIFKIFSGIIAHSSAMIADGIDTATDIIGTLAVMIGVKFSSKSADKEHPYGHEKIESAVTVFLSIMLFFTAMTVVFKAIQIIISGEIEIPGKLAIIAAIVSIITKESMYWYTIKAAQKVNSTALKADAWHHRSDAFSSIGVFAGVGGALLGFPIFDPIASIIACIFILKVSFKIFLQSYNQLIDKFAGDEIDRQIRATISLVDGVRNIDDLKTRMHGSKIYVDVEIAVDSENTVKQGHIIAENVHNIIENNIDNVKHCMVHVNPF